MENKLNMFYWCALPEEDGTDNEEHEVRFRLKVSAKKMEIIRELLGQEIELDDLKRLTE